MAVRKGRSSAGSGRRETFSRQQSDQLDDWLEILEDGTVMAFSGKVELGTGTRTALAQIVAEELDLPLERVHMVMADTELTPDEGYTAGSMTVQASGSALRKAAAEVRLIMLEMAAERLDANSNELAVKDGVISVLGDPARSVSYGQLMGGKAFNQPATGRAPAKSPQSYQLVGKSTARVDLFPKVTGQISFIQDLTIPGMLHGRVVRPPGPGARLISVDDTSVAGMAGLIKVVRLGDFLGLVAEREEQAVQAAAQLKAEWQETPSMPPMKDLYAHLRAMQTDDVLLHQEGDFDGAFKKAGRQFQATYYQPYHAHASIGPSCAIADFREGEVTVYSSTPGPYPLRSALAQLLEMPEEQVHIVRLEGAGGYGQNGSDDVAADAAILSRAVGQPVRVQWSRQDEFVWEPKAPAAVMEVRGALDAQGNVAAWDYQIWSPTHTARPRFAGQLLTAQLISGTGDQPPRWSFGAERNARTNYRFPNQRVTIHWLPRSPLRASSFRSLGGAENTFANESFMDELAAAAGADPIQYRLRYLDDPRCREVLQAAADKAQWETRPSPRRPSRMSQDGLAEGRGVSFARYENDQAILACIAFVQVNTKTGEVRVPRIIVAHDCGLIINPNGVENQIEGNVVQSLSRALKEEVKFTETRLTSVDWDTYPIMKFSEAPEIEIILIDRPDEPSVGAGEPSTVTTAAAVANAIFDATGARLRQIPFVPERVKSEIDTLS